MLGWHAPRLRRVLLAAAVGLVVALVTWPFTGWELALLAGWDVAAALFLAAAWYVIVRADAPSTALLANREDETRRTATVLVLAASLASLLAVGHHARVGVGPARCRAHGVDRRRRCSPSCCRGAR